MLMIFIFVFFVACGAYQTPPPTFEAKTFTTWSKRAVNGSRRAEVLVEFTGDDGTQDLVSILRLDLVGNDYERGYAHGYLLAKEIVEFQGPALSKYFADEVLDIDISGFPEPLQDILRVLQLKGAVAAPDIFRAACAWVWDREEAFVPKYIIEELDGMGEGLCASLKTKDCTPSEWTNKLRALNMLPELIRMACTAYGAWGKATATGKGLIQVRALDFGTGPWANFTVAATYRDRSAASPSFVSITFPGFVGAITGVSQSGIGISEKVWMTYDTPDLQPGTYEGRSDTFVLRDILQNAKTRTDAEAIMKQSARTWAMWVGVGDHATQKFDLIGYKEDSAIVYDDVTMPSMTGQPYIDSIAYVDKHPQPSGEGPTGTLPTALLDFYGNISLETSKIILQYHQSGDVHIAAYDFDGDEMYLAIGKINVNGKYHPSGQSNNDGMWCAYNRPWLKFSLNDLWDGK